MIVDRSSVSELIGAPKDVLSSRTVNLGVIQARYTFNESIAANSYHSKIVREQLTRRIPDLIPAICDEFVAAFDDELTVGEGFIQNELTYD